MKTAICLYGHVGSSKTTNILGSSDLAVLDIGYEHYFDHLISKNDADVFIHSWDTRFEKDLIERYQPKDAIIQDQIMFDTPSHLKHSAVMFQMYSKFYSAMMANNLKCSYEERNKFKYDCVYSGRFDQAWEVDVNFDQFDMDYFYAGGWSEYEDSKGRRYFKGGRDDAYNKLPKFLNHWFFSRARKLRHFHKGYPHFPQGGILDPWFFSSSHQMNVFCDVYNHMDSYYAKGTDLYLTPKGKISNHNLPVHHLYVTGLLPKLRFAFEMYDDFPSIRRKYFNSRK